MRVCMVAFLALLSLTPATLSADAAAASSVRLAHYSLRPGQTESLVVQARDLDGNPLVGASVSAIVHYGKAAARYSLPATDARGQSRLTFKLPSHVTVGQASMEVVVTNGFLTIPLSARFTIQLSGSAPAPRSTPKGPLVIVARILPPAVYAPQPTWLVVYVRSRSGTERIGAPVDASALYAEGTRSLTGLTDAHGVATIRLDTRQVRASQTVQVGVVARWHNEVGTAATSFAVRVAGAKPTATPSSTPTASPTATPTASPTPSATPTSTTVPPLAAFAFSTSTPTDTPADPPTGTPTLTAPAASTVTPTMTPTATATSTPVPSATSTPTPTLTPTVTPTATGTPTATLTSTPVNCPGSEQGCMHALLGMLNQARASNGAPPLELSATQSFGTSSCMGAKGHSMSMAQHGAIGHWDFPADICSSPRWYGENVGQCATGNEYQDLQCVQALMMSEQHDPQFCQVYDNHACNIISTKYNQVGIGLVVSGGATWVTEDFLGTG